MTPALDPQVRIPNQLWIGGEWRDAASGKTFATGNPATEEKIADVAEADRADIDLAVGAAQKAFESGAWPKMNVTERARVLWRIGDLLLEHADELARLETMNNGKPIFESRQVDIPAAAACFQYYAGWVTKIHGSTIPVPGNYLNYTLREPLGVVGAIIPWNFPILMAAWKLAPALATGNTVVLKPAEQTPLTALRMAEIFEKAGVPAGVINIVPGYGPTAGAALVKHPGVAKIAFTGSTAVGKEIMRSAADTLKKVSLELGGKSPNIVFADADLDAAVRGAINGIFYGKGEVCAAGSRLFVEQSVHDQFLEKLAERAAKLTVGDPMHPKTRLGALVSSEQMNKVLGYIESGKSEGARLVTGGERAPQNGKGFFVKPTIFDRVDNSMKIAREEIFGPVLAAIEFKDIDDAIAQANNTIYGLAAAVWTRDVKKAHKAARAIKAGTVWVNTYNMLDTASPFGGYKMSGFGRELGEHALDLYTQVKSVWVDLND
jgi:acyl-CoA reductase-like NAD-dependent aldehyde dehydrogenase